MPLFPLKCHNCDHTFEEFCTRQERDAVLCPVCKGPTFLVWNELLVNADYWQPITLEHIADEPMTFTRREDLQKYCKEKGLVSGALRDV